MVLLMNLIWRTVDHEHVLAKLSGIIDHTGTCLLGCLPAHSRGAPGLSFGWRVCPWGFLYCYLRWVLPHGSGPRERSQVCALKVSANDGKQVDNCYSDNVSFVVISKRRGLITTGFKGIDNNGVHCCRHLLRLVWHSFHKLAATRLDMLMKALQTMCTVRYETSRILSLCKFRLVGFSCPLIPRIIPPFREISI